MEKNLSLNRRTFNLVTPIFFQSVFQSFFSTADTFMVSQLSDQAVAAIGIANSPIELICKVFQMISLGMVILIPQLLGNDNKQKANEISICGIWLGAVIGLSSSCCVCFFSKNIISVYNVEEEVFSFANIYLKIIGVGLLFQSLMIVFTAIMQSYEKAKTSMYVSIFANIINVGIDAYVIFFIRPGENIGIMIVAFSTIFSQFLAFVILMILYNKQIRIKGRMNWRLQEGIIIIKTGCPAVGETFSYSASQMVITWFISGLGTSVLSGYIYAMNIMVWVSRFPLALGKSSGIIAGSLIGEQEYTSCKTYAIKNMFINVFVVLISGLLVISFSSELLGIFTSDENILKVGFLVMAMEFIALFGKGVNFIMGDSIRSTGNPLVPAAVGIFSMWFLGVLGSFLLGICFSLGILGIEIAFISDEFFRAGILTKYWLSDKWKNSKYLNLKN